METLFFTLSLPLPRERVGERAVAQVPLDLRHNQMRVKKNILITESQDRQAV